MELMEANIVSVFHFPESPASSLCFEGRNQLLVSIGDYVGWCV